MEREQWIKDRVARIKEQVSIIDVLSHYGFKLYDGDVDQQFPCDMHGDGSDQSPSARVYPDTASWYCWGCGKNRDAIDTVREREGVTFIQACIHLEKIAGLDIWNVPEDFFEKPKNPTEVFKIDKTVPLDSLISQFRNMMQVATDGRVLDKMRTLKFWHVFDHFCWLSRTEPEKARKGLTQLLSKLIKALQEAPHEQS